MNTRETDAEGWRGYGRLDGSPGMMATMNGDAMPESEPEAR